MPIEDFKRNGYEVIDWIADYYKRLESFPVLSANQPGDLNSALPLSAPKEGEDFKNIFGDVEKMILPAVTHWNHPNFHGLFATSTSSVNVFAEMLSAAFDMKAMLWRTSPASTELEPVVLGWFRQMISLPDTFKGLIYDTASISTLHGIAMARENLNLNIRESGMSGRTDLPLLRVYCSDQTHNSIDKAVILLGLGKNSIVKIPSNNRFEMITEKLLEAIESDKKRGYLPLCVVATIGTTSSSSVDDVESIAAICKQHNLWLHVDAAYAGSAAVVPELQKYFKGWEQANSIVINPHKWFFTSFDLSVLYVQDLDLLKRTFSLASEYLKVTESVPNQMDYGIQLGRRFRSLKLWFVMRYFGQSGLIERLRDHCRLANLFADWVNKSSDFEMMAPVPFALVCFRACPTNMGDLDALNERLMNDLNASGEVYLSPTKLNNKTTIRLSIGSIHVEERHLKKVWDLLNLQLGKMK